MPRNNKKGTRSNWRTVTLDIHVIPWKGSTPEDLADAMDTLVARCKGEISGTLSDFGFTFQDIKKFHNMTEAQDD